MDLPMAATYSFVYLLIQSLKIIFIEYLPCDRHMDKSWNDQVDGLVSPITDLETHGSKIMCC